MYVCIELFAGLSLNTILYNNAFKFGTTRLGLTELLLLKKYIC